MRGSRIILGIATGSLKWDSWNNGGNLANNDESKTMDIEPEYVA